LSGFCTVNIPQTMWSSTLFEERDCSLVEGWRCRLERGDGWGDSFQGGTKRAPAAQRRSSGRGRQREQASSG
jgi:hypothetical protein